MFDNAGAIEAILVKERNMFGRRKLFSSSLRAAAMFAGAAMLSPFCAFADSIPAQISVNGQAKLPVFDEVGKAGAMPYVLTVKNSSTSQTIGFKTPDAISTSIVSKVEIGHVDPSDTVVPPTGYASTTCIKANGHSVLLNPGKECTFTYLITPVGGGTCPGKTEEPCDSGATTIKFTVNPSLGPSVSAEPTFVVNDVPKPVPEPGPLTLFATGALGLAGLVRISRGKRL
jgi:hypothetical protein